MAPPPFIPLPTALWAVGRGIKEILGASRAPKAPGSPPNPQGTKTKNQIWREHYIRNPKYTQIRIPTSSRARGHG